MASSTTSAPPVPRCPAGVRPSQEPRALREVLEERAIVRLIGGQRNVVGPLLDASLSELLAPYAHALAIIAAQLLRPRGHALARFQIDVDRFLLEVERHFERIEDVEDQDLVLPVAEMVDRLRDSLRLVEEIGEDHD